MTTPARFYESRTEGRLRAQSCTEAAFFIARIGVHKGQPMNHKIENGYVADVGDAIDDLEPPRAPSLTFASASPNSSISAVRALLAERINELARELLPNGRAQGETWRVGGLDGAAGDSMAISLTRRPGLWIDHATGQKGDALDLVKGVRGYDTPKSIVWAEEWLDRVSGQTRAPAPCAGDDGDEDRRVKWALAIWNDSMDPCNTLADTYLSRRGLKLTDALAVDVIRYHRACPWARTPTARRSASRRWSSQCGRSRRTKSPPFTGRGCRRTRRRSGGACSAGPAARPSSSTPTKGSRTA